MAELQLLIAIFILIQIEIIFVIVMLLIILSKVYNSKLKKDPLLNHVKEFLIDGFTLSQIREKLHKLGFSKERTDKIMEDFLQRN